jgi:hypothetical protein
MKFFCFYFIVGTLFLGLSPVQAGQEPNWKEEYGAVCSETQGAVSLSVGELQEYIFRCEKVQERLDELNGSNGGTEKKVYARRLKMCRDVYEYTLQYKNREE